MTKTKLVIYVLIAIIVVSLGVNAYQWSTSQTLTQQNDAATTKQQMLSQLIKTQTTVNTKLAELDLTLQTACQKLSLTGLTGSQADDVLREVCAENPLIVNAATADAKDLLVAIQPTNYSSIIGKDISDQEQNVHMHLSMAPTMSDVIPLVEGFPGVVMVAPIFDGNDRFMGSLSLVIQPSELIRTSIAASPEGTSQYSMWAIQLNGTLIYDPDPTQQGKNLFTDPIYTDYPEVHAFTQQAIDSQTGYGTYQYYIKNLDQASNQVVSKEGYWTTVGIYGSQWRLVVIHALNP